MPRKKYNTKSKFEDTGVKFLRQHKVDFEYESLKIPYQKTSIYVPDFILIKSGIIIEFKGRFRAEDRAKHLLIKEQHPEYDIRFVFLFDNKLNKSSHTRYSDWCVKHGFQYAVGMIPKEWLEETNNVLRVGNV